MCKIFVVVVTFLNQVCAGHRPAHTWFLKIVSVQTSVCVCVCVCCVCVCPSPRLLIISGVMWHDMDSILLVKQVLQLLYCMATVVIIINRRDLGIGMRCRQ